MGNVGYATLQVIPSLKGIEGNLSKGLAGPMTSAGTKAGKTLGASTSKSFGGALKGVATLATGLGAYFVGTKLHEFFSSSITEAREAQKVTAQTAAVLKSTGGAANVSAKQIGTLATAISNKVGVDDEAIQSGENLLLTFRNIKNEAGKGNDVFNQATQAITDLSAGMGQDLKSSAVQVGKALNDPIKGITALSRVGVTFTQQQKDQIKTLVDSGNTLKAQKIILGELSKEFAGSAAAQATAGDKLRVMWGNFEESIGTALLPVLDDLANWLLKVGPPAAAAFVKWFQGDGIKGLRTFGDDAIRTAKNLEPLAKSLLHSGKDALPALAGGLKAAVPLLKTLADTFNSLPDGAQKLIVLGAGAHYLQGRLGPLSGVLPGLGSGMGLFARNTTAAGDAAKGAKGSIGGLATILGGDAFIALGLGAADVTDSFKRWKSAGDNLNPTLKGITKQLEASNLGKNADDFHINVDKLAGDIAKFGDKGAYFQKVMGRLQGDTGIGAFANAELGAIIPGYTSHVEKATNATTDLLKVTQSFIKASVASRLRSKGALIDLSALLNGMPLLTKYRDALMHLPKSVLTKVVTPGAVQSVKDVEDLQKKFHLQPRQVRTIMNALDFATPKIRKVMKDLDAVHHKSKPIPITADARKANQQIELTGHSLFKLDKTKVDPKLNADARPLMTQSQKSLQILRLVGLQHPKALISVDAGAALARLAYVKQQLDAIKSKTVTVNIEQTGGAHRHAAGGFINGPGTATSDSIPAMLSKGEFVVNAAATKRHLALLQSINAQRFAAGGHVGGGSVPTGGRVALTITNWRDGTGYLETVADDRVGAFEQRLERKLNVAART